MDIKVVVLCDGKQYRYTIPSSEIKTEDGGYILPGNKDIQCKSAGWCYRVWGIDWESLPDAPQEIIDRLKVDY